jgi:hypothetical protein
MDASPMVTAPQHHRASTCPRRSPWLLLVPALALVAGCHSGGSDVGSQLVEVSTPHTSFGLDLDHGWAMTRVYEGDPCGSVTYVVDDVLTGEDELAVSAVPTDCPEASQNSRIGNGRHGVYRTIADVPAPLDQKQVTTPIGPGLLFDQAYYECTNRCDHWTEPVVIITLDHPVDPAYPTLVVRGTKDAVARARLTSIVEHASG